MPDSAPPSLPRASTGQRGAYARSHVVYLGVSGVLHPSESLYRALYGHPPSDDGHRLYEAVPILEEALSRWPDASIVLTSTLPWSQGLPAQSRNHTVRHGTNRSHATRAPTRPALQPEHQSSRVQRRHGCLVTSADDDRYDSSSHTTATAQRDDLRRSRWQLPRRRSSVCSERIIRQKRRGRDHFRRQRRSNRYR